MSSDFDISKGKYWQQGLQLVEGCTPCSPGCDNCWSASMAHRFGKRMDSGEYLTDENGRFGGYIKTHPDRLDIPLRRKKPTVYAIWNDLFHEDVPDTFRDDVYDVMNQADQHVYLILTKRPQVVSKYINDACDGAGGNIVRSHFYHGLTVCNQAEADEKIPVFLQVPGKKFLSIEPMLGEINIIPYIGHKAHHCKCGWHDDERKLFMCGQGFYCPECETYTDDYDGIGAVILGGETGPGARPMHPDWVRSIRDQCAAAGTDFFFKQWGEWVPCGMVEEETDYNCTLLNGTIMCRVGKKAAGRLLDGREHNDLPWA